MMLEAYPVVRYFDFTEPLEGRKYFYICDLHFELPVVANVGETAWCYEMNQRYTWNGASWELFAAAVVHTAFAISVASAAVVSNDSYFRIWPAGSDTVQSVGSWS